MKRILVVDDSSLVRKFHINILKVAGYTADGAADGVEALEKALSSSYQLIIADVNMPNMDGLTFTKKYRDSDDQTPIIILTTQEQAIHRQAALDAGANIYLVKPARPDDLLIHVRLVLGGEA